MWELRRLTTLWASPTCYRDTLHLLCHEDIWGTGGIPLSFLTSALDGGEWSASHPCRFTPGERVPGTHCTGGWVGPRGGLDAVERKKILPLPGIELGPSLYCATPIPGKATLGRNFYVNNGWGGASRDACSATSNLRTNSAFVRDREFIQTVIKNSAGAAEVQIWEPLINLV
jgi:hypothetical protein